MKMLIRVIIICILFVSPAFAAHMTEDPGNDERAAGHMMNRHGMIAMQSNIEEMQTIMNKIKQETDPEKRKQLMQEHMQSMQSAIETMNEPMGDQKMPMMSNMDPTEMEHCMNVMQVMMGQMSEHHGQMEQMEQMEIH